MDEFKKYLRTNREELDVHQPDEQVWERIAYAASAPVKKNFSFVWIAAAAITAILITLTIFFPDKTHTKQPIVKTQSATEVHPQFKAPAGEDSIKSTIRKDVISRNPVPSPVKKHVKPTVPERVESEIRRIQNIPLYAENPQYLNAYRTQLQKVELQEKLLEADIANYGMNDQFLEQLIHVNQRKLRLLKDLQVEINKMNTRRDQNIKNIKPYYLQL